MESRSVVGKRLRGARLRAGISQKQLGMRAGIDELSASPLTRSARNVDHSAIVSAATGAPNTTNTSPLVSRSTARTGYTRSKLACFAHIPGP